jgi:hypothetical protein
MSKHEPRLFDDDAAIRRIGEGLLACSLARDDWTHEAHLAACLYLLAERPDIQPERDLPNIIRRFNESVGGVNDARRAITRRSRSASSAACGAFSIAPIPACRSPSR